jgi:hypothetical protein
VAAFVLLAYLALSGWFGLSFSELRLEHERHHRVAADIRALDCQLESYKTRSGSFHHRSTDSRTCQKIHGTAITSTAIPATVIEMITTFFLLAKIVSQTQPTTTGVNSQRPSQTLQPTSSRLVSSHFYD